MYPRSMPRQLDEQVRSLIITAYNNKKSISEIATLFGCSKSSVHRVIKAYLEEGRIDAKKRGGLRAVKFYPEHLDAMKGYITENCSITLEQIGERLLEDFNISASVSTIHRAIDGFFYTLKRTTRIPALRNDDRAKHARYVYAQELLRVLAQYDGDNVIFVDEIGFNVSMRAHRGRSLRGTNAVQIVPHLRCRNISVCCAMLKHGTFHYRKQDRAFNTESFLLFLDELFKKLEDVGMSGMVIIMDNVPFHKSEVVKEKIISSGHLWGYLPPYSPFLNPIENMFSEWKQMVRSSNSQCEASLLDSIDSSFERISGEHCHNYYTHMFNMALRCLNMEDITDE
jgi:transposase